MENNKNKKSVKFQGDMLNFYDFIQVFVFTTNHHLKTHVKKVTVAEVIKYILFKITFVTCINLAGVCEEMSLMVCLFKSLRF